MGGHPSRIIYEDSDRGPMGLPKGLPGGMESPTMNLEAISGVSIGPPTAPIPWTVFPDCFILAFWLLM